MTAGNKLLRKSKLLVKKELKKDFSADAAAAAATAGLRGWKREGGKVWQCPLAWQYIVPSAIYYSYFHRY